MVFGWTVFSVNDQLAAPDNGLLELTDLIAFRQIGVEIVFSIEHRIGVDLGANCQPEFHRHAHGFFVQYRQHAWEAEIDRAGLAVGLSAKCAGRSGKNLAAGSQLNVDFQTDHAFPGHAVGSGRSWWKSVSCWKAAAVSSSVRSAKWGPISCIPSGRP